MDACVDAWMRYRRATWTTCCSSCRCGSWAFACGHGQREAARSAAYSSFDKGQFLALCAVRPARSVTSRPRAGTPPRRPRPSRRCAQAPPLWTVDCGLHGTVVCPASRTAKRRPAPPLKRLMDKLMGAAPRVPPVTWRKLSRAAAPLRSSAATPPLPPLRTPSTIPSNPRSLSPLVALTLHPYKPPSHVPPPRPPPPPAPERRRGRAPCLGRALHHRATGWPGRRPGWRGHPSRGCEPLRQREILRFYINMKEGDSFE
jgi:hypothetical protein